MALAVAADAIARSYRYYSQIIDARLASGYLTSRPGLYAAPRVLRPGKKLSREKLVAVLRRAGYSNRKRATFGVEVLLFRIGESRFDPVDRNSRNWFA
jgi:hypothetical protein